MWHCSHLLLSTSHAAIIRYFLVTMTTGENLLQWHATAK